MEAGSKIPWLLLALSGFLVRGVAVLVLGIFLHSLGMIGAADLKLVALLAAWLGFSETIKILCVGFILGAVWSLQKMLRYGSAFQRFLYLSAYIRQILSNKKIEKYYDPVRDGTECVILWEPAFVWQPFWSFWKNGSFRRRRHDKSNGRI